MKIIGKYFGKQIHWLDYDYFPEQIPKGNWVCLAVVNKPPNPHKFDKFVRTAVKRGILEFKAHGKFGEKIHDLFDETLVIMEVMENRDEIDVMTTWHNNQPLADAFWQCFFATCLPESADDIKIVCTDLDGVNRSDELKNYLNKYKLGWLPPKDIV